ncbi:hypothetical protein H0Z60_16150 [Ectothiorhodospiraceae bacterium WFHF3C12]|nr:hypothetical protein [Ectothiorhodospiraceae bacterium WFHF3C12]
MARQWYREPWLFIVIGIAFNIIAALMSHYLVEGVADRISALDESTNRLQQRIDSAWSSRLEAERKRELLLLHADYAAGAGREAGNGPVAVHVRAFLERISIGYLAEDEKTKLGDGGVVLNVDAALIRFDRIVEAIQDHIDALYLDALQLERQKAPLRQQRNRLGALALFLQVLGLILVLSRDLVRRRGPP